jgi:hypothetical protein
MAITIQDQPYAWSPRGQRLIFYMTSDNSTQPGFRVQATVTATSSSSVYTFMLSVDPYGGMIYDLGSLVSLRNYEETATIHAAVDEVEEPIGSGYEVYSVIFEEYWIVGGVLTPSGNVTEPATVCVVNGYYQMSDGYKPYANLGNIKVKYALSNFVNSRAMSDRYSSTHTWLMKQSAIATPIQSSAIYIGVREADYGLLYIPGNDTYLPANAVAKYRITIYDSAGTAHTYTSGALAGNTITGLGVYPANINDSGTITEKPSMYAGWRYYVVTLLNAGTNIMAAPYVFYNAELYGQSDCRYDAVRLAWVNSRSGWDYFNFIKKNEITDTIERKQYKQTRWRGQSPFYISSARVLTDRDTIVTQTMTITSDWVQENEYVFLRSLLASNQVQIVKDDGISIPVSVDDTNFLERKERNGKLYNIVLKLKYSQDYWT